MSRTKYFFTTFIAVVATIAFPLTVVAIPIDAGLSIIGSTVLDDSDADLTSNYNSYSADLYSVVGGFTSGAVSNVGLSDTGDGFGHAASLFGVSSDRTVLGADYSMLTTNNTTDAYSFTFGITFSHSADADSGDLDARARTRLNVREGGMYDLADAYLYSELTSESGYDYAAANQSWTDEMGDETSVTDLGTNGELVSYGETRYFTFELLAGEIFDLDSEFTIDGRTWDVGATYDITSNMYIFLDSFENMSGGSTGPGPCGTSSTPSCESPVSVPEPSSIALLGLGLLGLGFSRRKKVA